MYSITLIYSWRWLDYVGTTAMHVSKEEGKET